MNARGEVSPGPGEKVSSGGLEFASTPRVCICECPNFPFYKDTSLIELEPTLMTLYYLDQPHLQQPYFQISAHSVVLGVRNSTMLNRRFEQRSNNFWTVFLLAALHRFLSFFFLFRNLSNKKMLQYRQMGQSLKIFMNLFFSCCWDNINVNTTTTLQNTENGILFILLHRKNLFQP